jgi:formylmethanofuran dehydrogenase subunit E
MFNTPKVKTHHIVIDNNSLHFKCEECEGEFLDTRVEINGTYFCTITWETRLKFILDFEAFMAKYRI